MRRTLAALTATAALALTACGGDSDSDTTTSEMGVEVAGGVGEKPTLTVPDEEPSDELQVEVLSEGDGAEVGETDMLVVDYLGQTWVPRVPEASESPSAPPTGSASGAPSATPSAPSATPTGEPEPYVFDNSYDLGQPVAFSLNGVIPGWKEGLAGQRVGSRVLLSIPPDQGYGAAEGHNLQNDTLVFVVDILDAIDPASSASGEPVEDLPAGLPKVSGGDGEAPAVDFADAAPPEQSDSTVVIAGDGEELGENIVVNMIQASYPDGADLVSTWDEGQAPLALSAQQLSGVPGLAEALEGQSVGTRVVSRISAKDNPGAGGGEGTPLLLVLDVIGTY